MGQSYMTPTKKVIQKLLKFYLERKFDIEVDNDITKKLQAPYLIVGNHQNNWDGFLVSIYVDELISFVISDEQYRNPILRRVLKYINAIPTIKAKIDISTIKRMLKAKKENRVIGLYPEGNRTWDGLTEPIYYSTAKLIKLLDIPVVIVKTKGGYLVSPRWAKASRKGKIFLTFEVLFTPEQIKEASNEEIFQILKQGLQHDEFAFQKEKMLPYRGKRLAEGLEDFLFACPACSEIDQLKSQNNNLQCQSCGYEVEYTEFGLFKVEEGSHLYYDNNRDWNKWQLDYLSSIILNQDPVKRTVIDRNVILKQGTRFKALKATNSGELSVDSKFLYYKPQNEEEIAIPIAQIDGLNLQVKNQLDLYNYDVLYRFSFNESTASPFKWFNILKILQQEAKTKKE